MIQLIISICRFIKSFVSVSSWQVHSSFSYHFQEAPFVQWKNDSGCGNKTTDIGDQLEGFLISIFEKLAEDLGFSYNISLVPDGKYGSDKGPPRGWTGMVRQLLDDVSHHSLMLNQSVL